MFFVSGNKTDTGTDKVISATQRLESERAALRELAGHLTELGMTAERAHLWARHAVDRARMNARRSRVRHSVEAATIACDRAAAERIAKLEFAGASPRAWL